LLLVLSVTSIAKGICGRHVERMEGVTNAEKLVALFDGRAKMGWRLSCTVLEGDVR
jgi:hypothetical protein